VRQTLEGESLVLGLGLNVEGSVFREFISRLATATQFPPHPGNICTISHDLPELNLLCAFLDHQTLVVAALFKVGSTSPGFITEIVSKTDGKGKESVVDIDFWELLKEVGAQFELIFPYFPSIAPAYPAFSLEMHVNEISICT
jgi:hypothetical protein